MGLFKKLGSSLKKATSSVGKSVKKVTSSVGKSIKKNVSLKNVLKVATPLMGAIPIVGTYAQGIVQNVQAEKEAKQAQEDYDREVAEQQRQQEEYDRDVAEQQRTQFESMGVVKKVLSPAVKVVAQSTGQVLAGAVAGGLAEGIGTGAKKATGDFGAMAMDLSITQWFKNNIVYFIGLLVAIVGAIWMLRKPATVKRARR